METSVIQKNYIWPLAKLTAAILTIVVTAAFITLYDYFTRSTDPNIEYYSSASQFMIVVLLQFPVVLLAILPLSILVDYLVALKWGNEIQHKSLVILIGYLVIGVIIGIVYCVFTVSPAYLSAIAYFTSTTLVFLAIQTLFHRILFKKRG